MSTQTLFVFGTLKRNFHNHHYLETSLFLGTGYTKNKYAMYSKGIPVVFSSNPISHIHGELYEVDPATLKQIDMLEGHPDWYCREQVEVMSETNQIITAWLYFYPIKKGRLIRSGIFEYQG